MALTLDSTIAGELSNSYVDVAYCDGYWANHYSTTKAAVWSGLSASQKEQLLIQACGVIESLRFTSRRSKEWQNNLLFDAQHKRFFDVSDGLPVKAIYTQALQFPRNVDLIESTQAWEVPESVMMAQCEQAVYLATFDDAALANRLQGVESDSLAVGGGALSVRQHFVTGGTALAPMAVEFLKPYLLKSSSRLGRG